MPRMFWGHIKNSSVILAVGLLVAAQLAQATHALEFGDTPHQHDEGVVCLTALTDTSESPLERLTPLAAAPYPPLRQVIAPATQTPAAFRAPCPPATGPPLS